MKENDGLLTRLESHEFLLKLEEAGLSRHLTRKVIDVFGNALAKKMMAVIINEEVGHDMDSRFKKIREFIINAPDAFTLDGFIEKYSQTVLAPHWGSYLINDENFRPTYPLVPVKKLAILYEIQKDLTSEEDCYCFLDTQEAHYPNAQWLALAWEQGKQYFPKSKTVFGFDQKQNLLFQDGEYHVTGINSCSEERASFSATGTISDTYYFNKGMCLLMIKDI